MAGIRINTGSSLLHRPLFTCFSPQLSPCFQPQNKSYPQLNITREKRGLLTLDFDLVTHHTLTLCSQPQNYPFWYEYLMKQNQPGGLNLTNSSKANQPMWSSGQKNQPLRSNQLINCWGSHNTHENQKRHLCLPRNLCEGYYIPISLYTKILL